MATKNDITGDSIASRVSNDMYRKGWDVIFMKKTPQEWLQDPEFNHVEFIMDPDGWRMDNTPMDKPLSRSDFTRRLGMSTVYINAKAFQKIHLAKQD
jgi:hypothetical protein